MEWKKGPPVLVGEKILWSRDSHSEPKSGVVKWIGNIPDVSSDLCVGIELNVALPVLGGDGFWKERKLFECRSKHGLLVPVKEIQKICSKTHSLSTELEDYSKFNLNNTKIGEFTRSSVHRKASNKTGQKNSYSYTQSKPIEKSVSDRIPDSCLDSKRTRKHTPKVLGSENFSQHKFNIKNQDIKISPKKKIIKRKISKEIEKPLSQNKLNVLNSFTNPRINKSSREFDSTSQISELIKNMNEIAGYFKEIKEGDEEFQKQEQTDIMLYDANDTSHSKPKKLFSFLKWFNKKHKNDSNSKLFKESSVASSPMFSRKATSSCESIDTLFSTQTVRSFAYIPPTQYMPSAPPLDYEKSSYENVFESASTEKNASQETQELIYEKRKKRRAPEPPRLSRENSLPTTLQHNKNDENDFDAVKTYHRRTVSESFKDKKAGAYCHVQGKRKAPPPPNAPLYPNIQKLSNEYPSLHKKKKPAPPPPESDSKNQNPNISHQKTKNVQKERETSHETDESKREKLKDTKGNLNEKKEEKGMKISQMAKDRLTKDASLSPLPSRPWYKRSHRDSTGSNIIRKDFLKGFDKKKSKEPDDWMPEVGFPRRSLSAESNHSKFNIFSKLERAEDKKKEEKRKSQISILTNISELDREAAEIVRKEQAEEKKMMAENDAKYYSPKENNEKIKELTGIFTNAAENFKSNNEDLEAKQTNQNKQGSKWSRQSSEGISQVSTEHIKTKEVIMNRDQRAREDELSKIKEKDDKDKENKLNPGSQSKENPTQNFYSPNLQGDLTNPSKQIPPAKISEPNQNSLQAQLNHFTVQNKELNYLNEPWVCKKCTLENPGWRVFCEMCSSIKSRFLYNNIDQKEQSRLEKEGTKLNKPRESNLSAEEFNQTTKFMAQTENKTENKLPSVKDLSELKKKPLIPFPSKSETLYESDKNEIGLALDDSEKNKLKKTLKEMKNFSPKNNLQKESNEEQKIIKPRDENNKEASKIRQKEENTDVQIKRKVQKESSNEEKNKPSNLVGKENAADVAATEERHEKPEQSEKSITLTEKPEKSVLSVQGDIYDGSKWKVGQNSQAATDKSQVAEAYIVTKTIVLEDIIVKKPDRGRKVSASVQTKSSPSTSPEKSIRPPPRAKKIALQTTTEADKRTQAEPRFESDPQKRINDYRQEDLEELTQRLTHAEGLADFRANIETMPLNTEMNTVAVNRLLRKLETAINCGDHFVAAGLAKELALMKINCSVTRQVTPSPGTSRITIDLYIEDKVSHQGPITLEVSPTMTLLQLKKKVQQELGIQIEVQRWILGKKLATDDNKTLEAEGVKSDYYPLFLYLVAPDNQKTDKESSKNIEKNSVVKPRQDSQAHEENSSSPKTKRWYYNYEEDHYSYCEDSENESKSSSSDLKNTTEDIINEEENANKSPAIDYKKTETEQKIKKVEKPPIFDLKSRDSENNLEKELKIISLNLVKQKVEKLNKTFAENARQVKPPLRSSRSLETWKCCICNVVNLPERVNCLSCNAKKMSIGPNNRKIDDEKKPLKRENSKPTETADENVHYKTLIELQNADLVPNNEPFNCSICMVDYATGEGVTLKDCLHTFCRACLVSTVQFSEDAEVKCPYLDEKYSCPSVLQQREIKALVPQKIFELHLAKSVKEAENKIENAFHCKTPDCKGWCIYEDNVNEFHCPVCRSTNCLTCQAIHNGINCREYQERMKDASETDLDAKKTRDMLNEMVEKGEAMVCPKCQVVLMKKWGCDWLKCSVCKTEICWVTRGFRWGPEGKGDTSGGCKCGVNGIKCHPKCNYCH